MAILKRSSGAETRRSLHLYVLVLFIAMGAVAGLSSDAFAGGVYLGFGVDVPLGYTPPPPVVEYRPPVVVERTPPPVVVERVSPPAVVVERTAPPPPPVMVRRVESPPAVVYDTPVVVEKRTTTYYYPSSSYQYRSYHEQTERETYRERSHTWTSDDAS